MANIQKPEINRGKKKAGGKGKKGNSQADEKQN
jgi:hypothetical protein